MINAGLIGTGSYGIKRAKSVISSSSGALLCIADIDSETAEITASELSIKHSSVDDMLKDPEIDVIIICTPNNSHIEYAKQALTAGKHVFCEKPIALNSNEAREIAEFSKKTGKTVKIGSNHRFFQEIMEAKKMVSEGAIGDILSFNGRIGHSGDRIQNEWRQDPKMSGGGTLIDNGWHMIDLASWFMGDFETVAGNISNTFWKDIEVEDTAGIILKDRMGRMATITSSWRVFSGYLHIELNGSDGFILIDSRFPANTDNPPLVYQNRKKSSIIQNLTFGDEKLNSMEKEMNYYFECIEKGTAPKPTAQDALEIMSIIERIYLSAH